MSIFKKNKGTKQDENSKKTEKEILEGMREIIIATDGNNIAVKKAEVSGSLELVAVLGNIISGIERGVIKVNPAVQINKAGIKSEQKEEDSSKNEKSKNK